MMTATTANCPAFFSTGIEVVIDEWGSLVDSYQGPLLSIDGCIHVEIYVLLRVFTYLYLCFKAPKSHEH